MSENCSGRSLISLYKLRSFFYTWPLLWKFIQGTLSLFIPERLERGGPKLTIETEVNSTSKSTNERGPSLVVSFCLSCRIQNIFFSLGWFVGLVVPVQKNFYSFGCSNWPSAKHFFPYRTLFQFLWTHRPESWAGSRAGSPDSGLFLSRCQSFFPSAKALFSHQLW